MMNRRVAAMRGFSSASALSSLSAKSNDCQTSAVLTKVNTSYFTVFVEGEIFGLSVSKAQTIFRISDVTPIPLGQPEIAGLVNLRGKVVTAVSLRRRLGFPDPGTFCNALAIGMEHGGDSFALVVDEIGDVLSLDSSSRIPMPPHF